MQHRDDLLREYVWYRASYLARDYPVVSRLFGVRYTASGGEALRWQLRESLADQTLAVSLKICRRGNHAGKQK